MLRVGFFFFLIEPAGDEPSSAPLPAGVEAADRAGLCKRDRAGVLLPLPFGDLISRKASSMVDALPCCVKMPASTFQISGPIKWRVSLVRTRVRSQYEHKAPTNSWLCEMITLASSMKGGRWERLKDIQQHRPSLEWPPPDHQAPRDPRNYLVRPARKSNTVHELMMMRRDDTHLRVVP